MFSKQSQKKNHNSTGKYYDRNSSNDGLMNRIHASERVIKEEVVVILEGKIKHKKQKVNQRLC